MCVFYQRICKLLCVASADCNLYPGSVSPLSSAVTISLILHVLSRIKETAAMPYDQRSLQVAGSYNLSTRGFFLHKWGREKLQWRRQEHQFVHNPQGCSFITSPYMWSSEDHSVHFTSIALKMLGTTSAWWIRIAAAGHCTCTAVQHPARLYCMWSTRVMLARGLSGAGVCQCFFAGRRPTGCYNYEEISPPCQSSLYKITGAAAVRTHQKDVQG